MDKGKMIPVLLTIVLTIFAIVILVWNSTNNKVKYTKLVVSYQGNDTVIDDLNVDTTFSLEGVNFYVSGIQKDLVVLRTDSLVTVNLKNSSEFKIDVNEYANVCFNNGACADFKLA